MLKPIIKIDLDFFVSLRERSCVLFPVPEDVVYSHALNSTLYSAQIQFNCRNLLLYSYHQLY